MNEDLMTASKDVAMAMKLARAIVKVQVGEVFDGARPGPGVVVGIADAVALVAVEAKVAELILFEAGKYSPPSPFVAPTH